MRKKHYMQACFIRKNTINLTYLLYHIEVTLMLPNSTCFYRFVHMFNAKMGSCVLGKCKEN